MICKDCDLHKTAQVNCCMGQGPKPTKYMIVGEAPRFRREEYQLDKPFSGKAGKILDIILDEVGISRESLYITNAMHCGLPNNRKPSMSEIKACRKHLLKEISDVNPKMIICLGDIALKGLFGSNLMNLSRERGKVLDFEGRKVAVTYHPGAAKYNKYLANIIYEDLRKIFSGEIDEKEEEVRYELVNKKNYLEAFNYIGESDIVAIDVETTGLDFMDPKLELVTINTSIEPYRSYVWEAKYLPGLNKCLENKRLVINHNIKFDLQWLNRYGVWIEAPIFDTMVAKHLLDENYPEKSLKHLARIELGMLALSEEEKVMKEHRKNKTQPTLEEWRRYGGGDTDAVIRLYQVYKKQLKEQGLIDLFKDEMRVLKTLTRMEIFGFQIDLKMHKKLEKKYKEEIEKSQNQLKREIGDVNLNSSKQLAKLLYKDLRLPVLKKTEGGAPSCDEATLRELIKIPGDQTQNTLELLLNFRRLNKLYNTYIKGLVENNLLKNDGKVHCDFKICGTKTGRLSCSDPNLENIPREGDIKKMFISSFKGGKIIQVDYSQMELRLMAHESNDKALLKAFRDKRDIHTETTAMCLQKPRSEVTPEERKIIGKRVNFGIVYLIGPKGLSENIGCSEEKAKTYINNWFKEFPGVKRWINERKEIIIQTGKSRAFTGRIRHLYGANHDTPEGREALRQGCNSPIQGGAGDITKYNMHRLDRELCERGFKARVINNVHDAVMVDSPKEEVKGCIKLIKELFVEPPTPLQVGLEFEIKVGDNWQDLKED